MATWTELITNVQREVEDPSPGVFHVSFSVYRYLAHAELLLNLRRSLYERTQTLTLNSRSPLYAIHATFSDFIRPLRVTVNGKALRWSSLASVGRLNRKWYQEKGEAKSVFMVGKTLLGFAPFPDAVSAEVTYLAAPLILSAVPAATVSPVIGAEWHHTMAKYAQALALAKEGSYVRAGNALKEFLALVAIERDSRFLEGLSQRSATATRTIERRAND